MGVPKGPKDQVFSFWKHPPKGRMILTPLIYLISSLREGIMASLQTGLCLAWTHWIFVAISWIWTFLSSSMKMTGLRKWLSRIPPRPETVAYSPEATPLRLERSGGACMVVPVSTHMIGSGWSLPTRKQQWAWNPHRYLCSRWFQLSPTLFHAPPALTVLSLSATCSTGAFPTLRVFPRTILFSNIQPGFWVPDQIFFNVHPIIALDACLLLK